jgi:hypothetical protein
MLQAREGMSTADSAEQWLNKRAADIRAKIDGMRAQDALDEAAEASDTDRGASVPQRATQDEGGPLQREDAMTLDVLRRSNRRERGQQAG